MKTKLILFFIAVLFFSSCERKVDLSYEFLYDIENRSSSDIYVNIVTDAGSEGKFIYPNEREKISVIRTEETKLGPFDMPRDVNDNRLEIKLKEFELYNLTDTMKWLISEADSLQVKFFFEETPVSFFGNSLNTIEENELIITDDFLNSLTEKDYSMLEKFKDYYGR